MKNKSDVRFTIIIFTIAGYLSLAFFAFAYLFLFPHASFAEENVTPNYVTSTGTGVDITASIGDTILIFDEFGNYADYITPNTWTTGFPPFAGEGDYYLVETTAEFRGYTHDLSTAVADEHLCIDTNFLQYRSSTSTFGAPDCVNEYVPPTPYSQAGYFSSLPPFYGAPIASSTCTSGSSTECIYHYSNDFKIPLTPETMAYFLFIFVISCTGTILLIKHFT